MHSPDAKVISPFHYHRSRAKVIISLLDGDFAHVGYLHTLVSDNATIFQSKEFKALCNDHGVAHLPDRRPISPCEKQSCREACFRSSRQTLRKSSLPQKYRRTPTSRGFSPSEMPHTITIQPPTWLKGNRVGSDQAQQREARWAPAVVTKRRDRRKRLCPRRT